MVDMLIIAETKLDNTFINSQFAVDNYHLWRADRNSRGVGLLVYIQYLYNIFVFIPIRVPQGAITNIHS